MDASVAWGTRGRSAGGCIYRIKEDEGGEEEEGEEEKEERG